MVRGIDEQMNTIEAAERAVETNGIIDGEVNRFEANAWLARTGWATHLAGHNRSELQGLAAPPKEDEHALQKVCSVIEVVMFRAQQKSQPEVTGWPVIDLISRREFSGLGETRYTEKPINTKQLGDTIVKYIKV